GPWYVAPDEWLVSGESLVRNLQLGMAMAECFGGTSRAGFVCDQFGHIGQLPQIFRQFGLGAAYVWRGTNERDHAGHFLWQSPDGTALPTYRFGVRGYGMFPYRVRNVFADEGAFDPEAAVEKLVAFTRAEAGRSAVSPILLFDGVDHLEIEPRMPQTIAAANRQLAADGIVIVSSTLDAYQNDLLQHRTKITRQVVGELRYACGDGQDGEEQWMIGGTYASRIPLKQSNAACEDQLCLWAEPFSTFASDTLGLAYPGVFLDLAWKHLLQNHPHDSMCGCSTDAVHRDMVYRFDQSMQLSSKLTENALAAITAAAARGPVTIGVFNATAEAIDEPVDLDVLLPNDWPTKFADNFASEQKYAFRLRGPGGEEVPYQLLAQRDNVHWRRTLPYKLSYDGTQHLSRVSARLKVPALGYTTLTVESSPTAVRYGRRGLTTPRSIENDLLRVTVNGNGTLRLHDKRTGHVFDQLLTFEDRADIGNGWFQGAPVNDHRCSNAATTADVAVIADGPLVGTIRIDLTINVPAHFDLHAKRRCAETVPLRITSEVTLRQGSDRLEIKTTVHNNVRDHWLRVLLPTGLIGDSYWTDSAFDAVERPVALPSGDEGRRELDLETVPQQSWTAFGDGRAGLAVVCRGLPETAVLDTADRSIALTLLRGFARVISRDDDTDGQILGTHVFGYSIVPFAGRVPVKRLFLLGQRANATVRQAVHTNADKPAVGTLPAEQSFLRLDGGPVITSLRLHNAATELRCFNPLAAAATLSVSHAGTVRAITLEGQRDERTHVETSDGAARISVAGKHIVTLRLDS
ncbi:MAG: glycoside hydrolase, partial [Phycisphaerales bacterium]|nr:glycoside hydrolase [Phycisphaerales bacterium]